MMTRNYPFTPNEAAAITVMLRFVLEKYPTIPADLKSPTMTALDKIETIARARDA